jgi:thymidylate synthase
MYLRTRNVNTAFRELVGLFDDGANDRRDTFFRGKNPVVRRLSRNGDVLVIDEPVTITYERPRERVLFNAARDANPMFHLFEALWMLAGRNDLASVGYYCSRMKDYSDDGRTLNGAYGYRWRKGEGMRDDPDPRTNEYTDQLDVIVNHLRADPASRRAVLAMWNVEDDLLKVGQSKDVCCNLNAMFSLREVAHPDLGPVDHVLDMTVTNRSNDLVWGLLGANYVHFSILQEYLAARLGASVGKYHHFTNNMHAYSWNWKPEEWLAADDAQPFGFHVGNPDDWGAQYRDWSSVALVADPERFEAELPKFVERHSRDAFAGIYGEPFLRDVAQWACLAWHHYKKRDLDAALSCAGQIVADDWRTACVAWLRRRAAKREGVSVERSE